MKPTTPIQYSSNSFEWKTPPYLNKGHGWISRKVTKWTGLSLCIFLLISTTVFGSIPDFLEWKWGLQLAEFRQLEIEIAEEWPIWKRATAVRLGQRAQELANAGSLILVFDNELGLVKTHWASKPIERDANGNKGMQLFKELKTKFTNRYGTPQETHEEASVKLQGFIGDLYQCLQEKTCGPWESIWETPEGGVLVLELVGLDESVGFVQMTHQGPNLGDALQQAHPGLHLKEQEI
ncbi:hypothetical protein [Candidatus Nitronereus thalassa]|uniref:Uncharacterized protein n=1 Tax=Candidatus Nitronereus thalassa TaxID=3020898 RepID=A0ABU3K6M0_9BACT|nr:hypothetical protein [Candidatus Nitronereus thalassa]MDT7041998.1 hypothetical protein [Candidatus Nitronereus thalassa]